MSDSTISLTQLARCARRLKNYMDQRHGPSKDIDWIKEAPEELAMPMDLRVLRVVERPGGSIYRNPCFTSWKLLPALPRSSTRFFGTVNSLPTRPFYNIGFSSWEFLEGVVNDADDETL